MRTQSIDTHPEIERIQIDMIRTSPLSRRFSSVASWTRTLLWANVHAWQKRKDQTSKRELVEHVLTGYCHPVLLQRVIDAVEMQQDWHLQRLDLGTNLFSALHRFQCLGIPSYLAGSIASSLYGMQQLAQDCDLVVYLEEEALPSFISLFEQDYVFDTLALHSAVQHHTVCSLIHLDTLMKLDLIVPQPTAFEDAMFPLVHASPLDERYPPFLMASATEMIVFKLQRYFLDEQSRTDGMNDDAEWNDLLGMLKVQGMSLDFAVLEHWITALQLDAPWQRARIDAGLQNA